MWKFSDFRLRKLKHFLILDVNGDPTLTPSSVTLLGGSTFTLTCTLTQEAYNFTTWSGNNTAFLVTPVDSGGRCNYVEGTTSIPADIAIGCPTYNVFTLKISNVSRSRNGETWQCIEYIGSGRFSSNSVIIQIQGKLANDP